VGSAATGYPKRMQLPTPRGPVSSWLCRTLRRQPGDSGPVPTWRGVDPLGDEDLQLSLALCYGLHADGIDGVDDGWEWNPSLVSLRERLEGRFEAALRAEARTPADVAPDGIAGWLVARSREADGRPSLSRFLARDASEAQFREFVIHRSLYTLHEADPHTFAIPRMTGAVKAALVEIQIDEYGGGVLTRMHSRLFATTMALLGLDPRPDAYLERLPATTLATVNLVWMFGLHRRLRGAAMGHLAMFELTSAVPNRRYGNGLRRLGYGDDATRYYDEHVEADSVHDMIAAHDVAGRIAIAEPAQAAEVVFGAEALALLEGRFAGALLGAWHEGRSSLRPVPVHTVDAVAVSG
jgi:heme oxygenase-like protein